MHSMTAQELIRQAAVQVPEKDLADIVRRIVEVAHPEKIILFGSAVRGTMGPNSDLDVLVIKRGNYHNIAAAQEIYRNLDESKYATDIIVVTPEQVEEHRDCFALVLYSALREGRVIYDRAAL